MPPLAQDEWRVRCKSCISRARPVQGDIEQKRRCIKKCRVCVYLLLFAIFLFVVAAILLAYFLAIIPAHRKADGVREPGETWDDSARPNAYTPALKDFFDYGGMHKVRGVNLGGWLILEPFITPSFFNETGAVDEYSLSRALGQKEAQRRLEKHYDTFVTEETFKRIVDLGFNHVRIPLPFWSIQEEAPYVHKVSFKYLLRGIEWARKYGLRIMLELHAAPGHQNIWNHCGRVGNMGWLDGTPDGFKYANRTLDILEELMRRFAQPRYENVVTLVGILNEPAIFLMSDQSKQLTVEWHKFALERLRAINPDARGPLLVYHDGFMGRKWWEGKVALAGNDPAIMDLHNYLIFNKYLLKLSRNEKLFFPCADWRKDLIEAKQKNIMTIVGEWSVAINDCGPFLNGVGIGTRWEGTYDNSSAHCPNKPCTCTGSEDWELWTPEYRKYLRTFAEKQMDAFEEGIGWFFWNFQTEGGVNPHWDYFLGEVCIKKPTDAANEDLAILMDLFT
ncbi:uncharacterized protein VTP21DRAFT_412 [Calcarisporiella thermophila]|uniref:uncharacterized protein n=1 Tax=Calcarisporiella thermophila TaxID=911321 RepID=UPI00374219C8